jgi:DnaJ-class molecular chaperone
MPVAPYISFRFAYLLHFLSPAFPYFLGNSCKKNDLVIDLSNRIISAFPGSEISQIREFLSQAESKYRHDLESDEPVKTHYEILGVSRSATQEEIRKAYRKLALQAHPDKAGPERGHAARIRAEVNFKRIALAHDVLGDPVSRRRYDISQPAADEYYDEDDDDFYDVHVHHDPLWRHFGGSQARGSGSGRYGAPFGAGAGGYRHHHRGGW